VPPISETGENEDTGHDAPQTPDADTANPDAGVETPETGSLTSSEQDNPSGETEGPKSMADAVAAALGPDDPDAADPEPGENQGDEGEAEGADDKAKADPEGEDKSNEHVEDGKDKSGEQPDADTDDEDDPTDEEMKGYARKPQKRIKQLLAQRNRAREEADGNRDDAEQYRQIQTFVEQNHLEAKEVQQLFQVGAYLKSGTSEHADKALEIIMPIAEQLLVATGRSVPSDLREKVESGEMTEEAARNFGRERHGRQAADRRAQRLETQHTQAENARQATETNTAIRTAVSEWHQTQQQSDPDFDVKRPFLRAAALEIIQEKGRHAQTAEEAQEFAKLAYDRVTERLRGALPQKKPTRPAPGGTGSNGNRADLNREPSSLMDAVQAGLRGSD